VFFAVDAPAVVVEDARSDEKEDSEAAALLAGTGHTLFAARVDPRSSARVGGRVRLAVDPSRFYFFSPDSGTTLMNGAAVPAG
jgi:hypothetical protein